jgi:hypothetical protein
VEGLTPSETEKEMVGRTGAGNVEAPAPTASERKKEKQNNNVERMDGTLSGAAQNERTK